MKAASGADAVLRRFDIDPEELAAAPKISDSLQACFGKWRKGNPREQIINYLAVSESLEAKAFLAAWRGIPKRDIQSLSIEAVCVRAHVSPLALFGAIVMAARNLKGQESALKAILAHPSVVGATVRTAKMIGPAGTADRKILHEAIGFLPTPKGGGIAINFFDRPKKTESDEPDDDDKAWDATFTENSISGKLDTWANNRRALTDGK